MALDPSITIKRIPMDREKAFFRLSVSDPGSSDGSARLAAMASGAAAAYSSQIRTDPMPDGSGLFVSFVTDLQPLTKRAMGDMNRETMLRYLEQAGQAG